MMRSCLLATVLAASYAECTWEQPCYEYDDSGAPVCSALQKLVNQPPLALQELEAQGRCDRTRDQVNFDEQLVVFCCAENLKLATSVTAAPTPVAPAATPPAVVAPESPAPTPAPTPTPALVRGLIYPPCAEDNTPGCAHLTCVQDTTINAPGCLLNLTQVCPSAAAKGVMDVQSWDLPASCNATAMTNLCASARCRDLIQCDPSGLQCTALKDPNPPTPAPTPYLSCPAGKWVNASKLVQTDDWEELVPTSCKRCRPGTYTSKPNFEVCLPCETPKCVRLWQPANQPAARVSDRVPAPLSCFTVSLARSPARSLVIVMAL